MITPAQQQIVAQWQQQVQGTTAQFQQLLAQAAAGCQPLVARNPTDIGPLSNALGAIGQQRNTLSHQFEDAFSACAQRISAAHQGPPDDTAYDEAHRQKDWARQWMEEQWMRFESQWRMEQLRAMWPHVQQALSRPAPCTRCGQPLQLASRMRAETVACPACRSQNQVAADPICATYFGMADQVAIAQTIDRRVAIDRFKVEAEERRRAGRRQTGSWPDEPIESLKHREKLEQEYWQAYVQARQSMDPWSPEQQKQYVDSRMKFFYDDMANNEVWRRAHGMASLDVRVPENARDWGPLRPEMIDDFYFHECLINYVKTDAAALPKALAKLGYRDLAHWQVVRQTFLAHWENHLGDPQFTQAASRAAMRAMNERGALVAEQNQGLLEPIDGVTIEMYANLCARVGNMKDDEFVKLLAQHNLDRARWDRASKAWVDRMSTDTTGTVGQAYSKAFLGAGQGQYGAAGAAAAQSMGAGGFAAGGGVAGGEPMSFEKFCEICGAMSAWSKQGKDVNAGLSKHFSMSAQDYSSVSMYWYTKMTSDMNMLTRQTELQAQYEQKWMAMP